MARLVITTEGFGNRVLELALGVNRVGREDDCEIRLDHATISAWHCELTLSDDGVYVCDHHSTNGTFVNGQRILEAWLEPGQVLKIGAVELLVESTAAHISLPKIAREIPRPPVVLPDGALLCPRHPAARATFKCPACREIMCNRCVRMIRIYGGKPLLLCCTCHQPCRRIGDEKPRDKKGFLVFLQETVRQKFGGRPRDEGKK